MPHSLASPHHCDSRLLALLTADQYETIADTLEPVNILSKQRLTECGKPIDYVYFPCTTVVSVLVTMQDGGIIRYNRGRMGILKREAIEDIACECYALTKAQFERSISPFQNSGRALNTAWQPL